MKMGYVVFSEGGMIDVPDPVAGVNDPALYGSGDIAFGGTFSEGSSAPGGVDAPVVPSSNNAPGLISVRYDPATTPTPPPLPLLPPPPKGAYRVVSSLLRTIYGNLMVASQFMSGSAGYSEGGSGPGGSAGLTNSDLYAQYMTESHNGPGGDDFTQWVLNRTYPGLTHQQIGGILFPYTPSDPNAPIYDPLRDLVYSNSYDKAFDSGTLVMAALMAGFSALAGPALLSDLSDAFPSIVDTFSSAAPEWTTTETGLQTLTTDVSQITAQTGLLDPLETLQPPSLNPPTTQTNPPPTQTTPNSPLTQKVLTKATDMALTKAIGTVIGTVAGSVAAGAGGGAGTANARSPLTAPLLNAQNSGYYPAPSALDVGTILPIAALFAAFVVLKPKRTTRVTRRRR